MEFDPVGSAQSIPYMIKNDTLSEVLDRDQLSEKFSTEIKQSTQKMATKPDVRTQAQQKSTSQSLTQAANKNIEELKNIPKSGENFDKIYEICQRIAAENDKDAMSFAVREKYVYVTGKSNCHNEFYPPDRHPITHLSLKHSHIRGFRYENIFTQAAKDNKQDLIRLLIVFGIDINSRDAFIRTALISASRWGHYEIVKLLLTVPGIDINAKDHQAWTALIYASDHGYYEIVKLLLAIPRIDVNAKTGNMHTALIKASSYGRHEIVKLLLAVPGIDVNAKNIFNKTALTCASEKGYHEIVKLLKAHDAI